MKRIKYEKDILDQALRARIIMEIEGTENRQRKAESYRRHLNYKDQTNRFVIANMLRQFKIETVIEMRSTIANISVVRKVIDKLARVFNNGVERKISDDEEGTKKLQLLERALNLNSELKKTNRVLKLQRNAALFLRPCPEYEKDETKPLWTLKPETLSPHNYDVVEDYYDRTKPLCFILSDFDTSYDNFNGSVAAIDPGLRPVGASLFGKGNGTDELIADKKEDAGKDIGVQKTYVWWSKNYHFTTDASGEILKDEGNPGNANPFETQMIIDFALDQDGSFWAEGGSDLIEGAILINSMLTHLLNIGLLQSYGQFYMIGENLPAKVEIGPNRIIKLEYKKDEQAEPKMGFLNANPNLDSLLGCIEAYLALLLTTNNLSTSGVSAQLSGGNDAASGIALIIDKAESIEDVQDQRQGFLDKEPKIFAAIAAFFKVYGASSVERLKEMTITQDQVKKITTEFNDQGALMSEKEKLETMKLRKDLGLDTMIGLLMRDNPSLTEQQAADKLKTMIKERMIEKTMMTEAGMTMPGEEQELDEDGNPIEKDPEAEVDPLKPEKEEEEKEDPKDESDKGNDDGQ